MPSLDNKKLNRIAGWITALIVLGVVGGFIAYLTVLFSFLKKPEMGQATQIQPKTYQETHQVNQSKATKPHISGAINPKITQENIGKTICNPKWSTKSIRPPVSYTNKLKIKQIKEYGYKDTRPADYEEDHLINLGIGGNPTSPSNLWPQPLAEARLKDRLEVKLQKDVCDKKLTLKEAQEKILNFWLFETEKFGAVNGLVQ